MEIRLFIVTLLIHWPLGCVGPAKISVYATDEVAARRRVIHDAIRRGGSVQQFIEMKEVK